MYILRTYQNMDIFLAFKIRVSNQIEWQIQGEYVWLYIHTASFLTKRQLWKI